MAAQFATIHEASARKGAWNHVPVNWLTSKLQWPTAVRELLYLSKALHQTRQWCSKLTCLCPSQNGQLQPSSLGQGPLHPKDRTLGHRTQAPWLHLLSLIALQEEARLILMIRCTLLWQ